jgi:hypothetical protein
MSGEIQAGLRAITSEPANAAVIRRFKRFFVAVAVVPVVVYLGSNFAFRRLVQFHILSGRGTSSPPILAGIIAVLTLNFLVGLFALGAVSEAPIVPTSSESERKTYVDIPEGDDHTQIRSSTRKSGDHGGTKTE